LNKTNESIIKKLKKENEAKDTIIADKDAELADKDAELADMYVRLKNSEQQLAEMKI
jgi:hypothetical protein